MKASLQKKEEGKPNVAHAKRGSSMAPPSCGISFVDHSLVQRKENKTGMPDNLKSGIESLSGIDMSDVKVHYNSSHPAQLHAHAFAQGNQIHIAPGQQKHLPHEAWHVVQQKQGRVQPTMQMKNKVSVNDDVGLEKEADEMGGKAIQMKSDSTHFSRELSTKSDTSGVIVQRAVVEDPGQVVHNRNVAVSWKGGGSYADTPTIINGKEIPPKANKVGMILEPNLINDNDRWKLRAATQHVGWRIELPGQGPWNLPAPVRLEELDAFAKAGGYPMPQRSDEENDMLFTLVVVGSPSNDAFLESIFKHEMHHTEEQNEVIEGILKPWDLLVSQNQVDAFDPLTAWKNYDDLNNPKAQTIADEIVGQLEAKGLAFHGTEEGKEPEIVGVNVNFQQRIYTVRLRGKI